MRLRISSFFYVLDHSKNGSNLHVGVAVGVLSVSLLGRALQPVSQNDLIDCVSRRVNGLREEGVAPSQQPGHQLHHKIGRVDSDGRQNDLPRTGLKATGLVTYELTFLKTR